MGRECKFKGKSAAQCCTRTTVDDDEIGTCIVSSNKLTENLKVEVTRDGKEVTLFRGKQLKSSKICMACLTFCDVCENCDTKGGLTAVTVCPFHQSCVTKLHHRYKHSTMVCGKCAKPVRAIVDNKEIKVCKNCVTQNPCCQITGFQNIGKCGVCNNEEVLLTPCDKKVGCFTKAETKGCNICVTPVYPSPKSEGPPAQIQMLCLTCQGIEKPANPQNLDNNELAKQMILKWNTPAPSPDHHNALAGSRPATSAQPSGPNGRISSTSDTPPQAGPYSFTYVRKDGTKIPVDQQKHNLTKEQVLKAQENALTEGRDGYVWKNGFPKWKRIRGMTGKDWERRRLTNQSLIDRFIRESERCIAS